MADTLGGLIDKLITIDMKMWTNQEMLYEIRRMKSVDEFKAKYAGDEGMETLWKCLQKACDLNVQRNQLIDEVDEKVIEIVKAGIVGESLDEGKFIQRKHKTYSKERD
jgi:RNAse (barnase) inhibitor barstar